MPEGVGLTHAPSTVQLTFSRKEESAMNSKLKRYKLSFWLFATLASLVVSASSRAARNASLTRAEDAPDLVVKEIVFAPRSPSIARVRVLNQGTASSSSCYLALQSLTGDDAALGTKQRVWTIAIPALEAGKGFSEAIDIAPLTQANGPWKA